MHGVLGDERPADREPRRVAQGFDAHDLAEFLDDAGEHVPKSPLDKTPGKVAKTAKTTPQVGAHRALPPIRTLTVGPGVPPGQPADGFGRVADCHRRFGISPTPEHAC
ncbi:hypothetical protein GCM10009780_49690 [Actinomadura alba]